MWLFITISFSHKSWISRIAVLIIRMSYITSYKLSLTVLLKEWLIFCEVYKHLFVKYLQVHLEVKIKLKNGTRLVKITVIDASVPNTCRRTFGMSPQSKPGTIPKLWHVKYSWKATVVSSLVAIKYVNVVSPRHPMRV